MREGCTMGKRGRFSVLTAGGSRRTTLTMLSVLLQGGSGTKLQGASQPGLGTRPGKDLIVMLHILASGFSCILSSRD